MSGFAERIAEIGPGAEDIAGRRWVYVPYDRYTDRRSGPAL